MLDLKLDSQFPGLLVSVRNVTEALTALEAGADVIDVKEPTRGSLGAADSATLAAIAQAVGGRAPVTAAMGELTDLATPTALRAHAPIPAGVELFKIGLAGCGSFADWQSRLRDTVAAFRNSDRAAPPQPVAVAYADWQSAGAPSPDDVLRTAIELHCPALLIDTWNKSAGGLFDHFPASKLRSFLNRAPSQNLYVVLAGSLEGSSFDAAVQLSPNLVAVRTAACDAGRNGQISTSRVHDLKRSIAALSLATNHDSRFVRHP
jgi:(5-formylfuran-3-yl)methyl phosphate synthase